MSVFMTTVPAQIEVKCSCFKISFHPGLYFVRMCILSTTVSLVYLYSEHSYLLVLSWEQYSALSLVDTVKIDQMLPDL